MTIKVQHFISWKEAIEKKKFQYYLYKHDETD